MIFFKAFKPTFNSIKIDVSWQALNSICRSEWKKLLIDPISIYLYISDIQITKYYLEKVQIRLNKTVLSLSYLLPTERRRRGLVAWRLPFTSTLVLEFVLLFEFIARIFCDSHICPFSSVDDSAICNRKLEHFFRLLLYLSIKFFIIFSNGEDWHYKINEYKIKKKNTKSHFLIRQSSRQTE